MLRLVLRSAGFGRRGPTCHATTIKLLQSEWHLAGRRQRRSDHLCPERVLPGLKCTRRRRTLELDGDRCANREHAGAALPGIREEERDHLDKQCEGVYLPVLGLDLVSRDDRAVLGKVDIELQPAMMDKCVLQMRYMGMRPGIAA